MLLVGLALGSALTSQFSPRVTTVTTESQTATYPTLTLTAKEVYHYYGVLTCETVSGITVTTITNFGGTVGLTTGYNASLTTTVYVITVATVASTTTYTQGSTPTC